MSPEKVGLEADVHLQEPQTLISPVIADGLSVEAHLSTAESNKIPFSKARLISLVLTLSLAAFLNVSPKGTSITETNELLSLIAQLIISSSIAFVDSSKTRAFMGIESTRASIILCENGKTVVQLDPNIAFEYTSINERKP